MKIILTEDLDKLGKRGSVVIVKEGFARNYLIPRKLAMEATALNLKSAELQKNLKKVSAQKEFTRSQALAQKLGGLSLTMAVEANEEDHLYGSVSTSDIALLLEKEGYVVEKDNVCLPDSLKSLGIYDVELKLHPEVKTMIKVWIVRK